MIARSSRARRTVGSLALFSLLALPFGAGSASAADLTCALNPAECEEGPLGTFKKNIGTPSRVAALNHWSSNNVIWGHYNPTIGDYVDFRIDQFGPGDWDLHMYWAGIHFLTVTKMGWETQSSYSYQNLTALNLDAGPTEQLMLSVGEFLRKMGDLYPDLVKPEVLEAKKKCRLEIDIGLGECQPGQRGVLFGTECKATIKANVKIICDVEATKPTKPKPKK